MVDLGRALTARPNEVRETRDIPVAAMSHGANGHPLARFDDLRPKPAAFHQDGLMSPVYHVKVVPGVDVKTQGFDEGRLGVENAPRRSIPLRSARADDQREKEDGDGTKKVRHLSLRLWVSIGQFPDHLCIL